MRQSEISFDPYSDDFFTDPYDTYRRMREEQPVCYNARYDAYALSRHADVAAALKDTATYSSAKGVDLEIMRSDEDLPIKSIIMMDPPEHRQMRSLVNKVFTPRAIQSQKAMITEQVDRFLGEIDSDEFDVVADFSAKFPVEVIGRMLGVPDENRQRMRHWIDAILHRESGRIETTSEGVTAMTEFAMMYFDLVQQRRANPADDMISGLIAAEVPREDGETTTLSDAEIAGFATTLGGAGAETVTKLVGNAAVIFAEHRDQWEALGNERELIPDAVEELLRFQPPSQYVLRYSMTDIELHGSTIPAGKPVFLVIGAANRDPEAFTEPDTFDIGRDRGEAQNLGFGYGLHSCLGAALARLESSVALDRLADFMPHYEVDRGGLDRVAMINVAGWSNVPVRVLR